MKKLKSDKIKSGAAGKLVLVGLIVAAMTGFAATSIAVGGENMKPASGAEKSQLPEGKQSTLGLYVTAAEAYEKWKASPDKVTVIDVRTPEEYAFTGHPEMVWNIPFAFVTYQRKDGKTEYGPKMNQNFVALGHRQSQTSSHAAMAARRSLK